MIATYSIQPQLKYEYSKTSKIANFSHSNNYQISTIFKCRHFQIYILPHGCGGAAAPNLPSTNEKASGKLHGKREV